MHKPVGLFPSRFSPTSALGLDLLGSIFNHAKQEIIADADFA